MVGGTEEDSETEMTALVNVSICDDVTLLSLCLHQTAPRAKIYTLYAAARRCFRI